MLRFISLKAHVFDRESRRFASERLCLVFGLMSKRTVLADNRLANKLLSRILRTIIPNNRIRSRNYLARGGGLLETLRRHHATKQPHTCIYSGLARRCRYNCRTDRVSRQTPLMESTASRVQGYQDLSTQRLGPLA